MTRIDKLYERLLANPRATIAFRDFEKLLKAFGFEHVRTTGSHRQYVHPKLSRRYRSSRPAKTPRPTRSANFLNWSESTAYISSRERAALPYQPVVVRRGRMLDRRRARPAAVLGARRHARRSAREHQGRHRRLARGRRGARLPDSGAALSPGQLRGRMTMTYHSTRLRH